MCKALCIQLTIVLVAILVAHLWPKQSHWRLTGRALPNGPVKWTPEVKKQGMIHMHFVGTGELRWSGNNFWLENHTFLHMFGTVPEMTFFSDTPLKAEAHIFV